MSTFNKLTRFDVPETEYRKIVAMQDQNKTLYIEQTFGSRKKLFVEGNLIATTASNSNLDLGELSQQQFYSFLGAFNRTLYKQFHTYPELFNLRVSFKGVARSKNIQVWNTMKTGMYFYNVDLSSAYWQMAYKLGYISKKLFDAFMNVDTYKEAKRYCISFLARSCKTTYRMLDTGQNVKQFTVVCDTQPLRQVYDNIRNKLYETIQEGISGIDDHVEYNIDGVSVLAKDLDVVRSRFREMGLTYKTTECRKVSDFEYTYGCKLRNFKKAINQNQNQNQNVNL